MMSKTIYEIEIKEPQTTYSKKAVDWFLSLSPDEVTAQMIFRYEDYHNDQQQELERLCNG